MKVRVYSDDPKIKFNAVYEAHHELILARQMALSMSDFTRIRLETENLLEIYQAGKLLDTPSTQPSQYSGFSPQKVYFPGFKKIKILHTLANYFVILFFSVTGKS